MFVYRLMIYLMALPYETRMWYNNDFKYSEQIKKGFGSYSNVCVLGILSLSLSLFPRSLIVCMNLGSFL